MSKSTYATPIWFGTECSKGGESLLNGSAAILNDVEQLRSKYCDSLKYVHAECAFYKHVETRTGENKKLVQKPFCHGGKLSAC